MHLFMCAEQHTCHNMCVDFRGQLVGSILPFHHVGSGAQTLVVMLGSKYLHLLRYHLGFHFQLFCVMCYYFS